MKYLASSAIALCVCGASGVYFVSDEEHSTPEIVETQESKIEAKISEKLQKADNFLFRPFLECEIEDSSEMTDEKIESHITNCMQNHYSWQPVQSYPN